MGPHKFETKNDMVKGRSSFDFDALRLFWSYCHDSKKYFLLGLGMMAIHPVLSMLVGRQLGRFIDQGLSKKNWDYALQMGLFIIVLEIFSVIALWQGRRLLSRISMEVLFRIRREMFDHLQALPIQYYDQNPHGRIITRLTHDVEGIESFFSSSLSRLLIGILMIISAFIAMAMTNLSLTLYCVAGILPGIFFTYLSKAPLRERNRKISQQKGTCNAIGAELISGIEVVRSFGLEDWAKDRYFEENKKLREYELDLNSFNTWVRPLISLSCAIPLVLLVWVGGYRVVEGSLTIGIFISFWHYCGKFFYPLMGLSREFHLIQTALTYCERVYLFLKESKEEDILRQGELKEFKGLKGDINYTDIWMKYPNTEKWILKGINVKISEGEKIGLVGATGSGKSTFVSLLARLYDFQKGELSINHQDIRGLDLSQLRHKIGYVGQNVILFRGSIRENLCPPIDMPDNTILQACEKTGLGDLLSAQGKDLSFEVLEEGSNLSVGERQLISLTRVFLQSPDIYIFDEATSNIDPDTEAYLMNALNHLLANKTCLIIAHRLDTLKTVDRVIVFDQGVVCEEGPWQSLLQTEGAFYHYLKNYELLASR